MKQSRSPLSRPAFSVILFIACFVLFGWPLLSLGGGPAGMFIYLFVTWGVVIGVLFFMSRSYNSPASGEENPPVNRNPDV